MNIIWRVDPKPTGQYACFQNRSWPSAEDKEGKALAYIVSTTSEEYDPYVIKQGKNAPLKVRIAMYCNSKVGFEWKQLKGEFNTVKDCKEAFEKFAKKYPYFFKNKEEIK